MRSVQPGRCMKNLCQSMFRLFGLFGWLALVLQFVELIGEGLFAELELGGDLIPHLFDLGVESSFAIGIEVHMVDDFFDAGLFRLLFLWLARFLFVLASLILSFLGLGGNLGLHFLGLGLRE